MKKVKLLTMVLVAVLSLAAFAGCTPTNQPAASPTVSPSASPTGSPSASPDNTAGGNNNVIIMGTNAEFMPFEFVTSKDHGVVGEYAGIDVEIATEIAAEVGKELIIDNMQFDSLISALSTGKIDFIAAGMTATEERAKEVDFSVRYFTAVQNIIVKSDDTSIKTAEDLKDKRVAVVEGYTGDVMCTDDLGVKNITRMKRGVDAAMELKNGKVDAVVIDRDPAMAIVSKNTDLKIVEDPDVFESEEYAIAVKKGNTELLEKINTVLDRMLEDGSIEELANKYAGIE